MAVSHLSCGKNNDQQLGITPSSIDLCRHSATIEEIDASMYSKDVEEKSG